MKQYLNLNWNMFSGRFGGDGWCGLVAKSCFTLLDPMDYSPLGSSVHGISQARILEWVSISFFRNQTCVSCIVRQILYH